MNLMNILLAILGVSLLVIVHELGHYLAARAFGMRVLRFSIGFGPVLARFQPKDSPTVFQISAIPFMAYVQIAGMNPAEDNDPDDPTLYPNKGVLARVITVMGGPFANYMAASVLIFGLAMAGHHGENPPHEPMVVDAVQPDRPAALAGIQNGDVIVEADGKPIRHVGDLIEVTAPRGGKPTTYIVERDGVRLPPLEITPADESGRGIIGILAKQSQEPMPVGRALLYSAEYPFRLTVAQLAGIAHMFEERTTEGVVGPVGIVKVVAKSVGSWAAMANILVIISVSLGMFNLLPLPALDGGRLVFLGYEVITRKRANERIEGLVHTVGIVVLLCLVALVTFRDVAG